MTSSKPNCLPKAPPPNSITSGAEFSTCEFQGDTNIQPIAPFIYINHFYTHTRITHSRALSEIYDGHVLILVHLDLCHYFE